MRPEESTARVKDCLARVAPAAHAVSLTGFRHTAFGIRRSLRPAPASAHTSPQVLAQQAKSQFVVASRKWWDVARPRSQTRLKKWTGTRFQRGRICEPSFRRISTKCQHYGELWEIRRFNSEQKDNVLLEINEYQRLSVRPMPHGTEVQQRMQSFFSRLSREHSPQTSGSARTFINDLCTRKSCRLSGL